MNKIITNKELLPKLIRTHGRHCGDGKYMLSLSDMKLYIDGRFCDEFEDDKDFRKCIVNYIAVDGDVIVPWFNMQATGGWVGLVWGDKYCIDNLGVDKEGRSNIAKVVKFIQSKYKSKTISDTRKKHLHQTEWLEKIKPLKDRSFLRGYKKDYSGCDFLHAVDCIYCCGSNNEGWSLDELERKIINDIDKHSAFIIRLQFPTISALMKSGYLSAQSPERYARWKGIIRKVNKRLNTRLPKVEYNRLFNMEFDEVFIKGRLHGEPIKPISKIKPKKIELTGRKRPDLCSHPDWHNASWDERLSYSDKKQAEMEEAIKKLGHPRFEVIFKNGQMQRMVESQLKSIQLINFYQYKERKCSPSRCAYSNRVSLPAIDTYIIDHLDDDKTPYLIGDLATMVNKFGKITNCFIKLNDRIIKIRTITESKISKLEMEQIDIGTIDMVIAKMIQHKLDDAYKTKKPELSLRTCKQYMVTSHKVIFDSQSLCDNYNMYEKYYQENYHNN